MTRGGGGEWGGSYFLIFSHMKTVEMILSELVAKQSHRTLSADSSIAQRRAFFAVTLRFQENMAVTAVNCEILSSWLVLIYKTEIKV